MLNKCPRRNPKRCKFIYHSVFFPYTPRGGSVYLKLSFGTRVRRRKTASDGDVDKRVQIIWRKGATKTMMEVKLHRKRVQEGARVWAQSLFKLRLTKKGSFFVFGWYFFLLCNALSPDQFEDCNAVSWCLLTNKNKAPREIRVAQQLRKTGRWFAKRRI